MLKMEARHELIQKMRSELTNAMKDLVKDEKRYRELLIKLIVQVKHFARRRCLSLWMRKSRLSA